MPTDAAAAGLQTLLSWVSPSYPVGAFSYSQGLEAEMASGAVQDAQALAGWVRSVLEHGAGRTDAILLAISAQPGADLDELSDLALALAASAERATEMREMGQAFARVTADVWGTDATPRAYAVAFGAAVGALDLPLETAVRMYLHGMAANLISAAVRFVPLGQTDGQRVLASLEPVIAAVAQEAVAASLDDIGSATAGADLAAMEHETLKVRIFRT